MFPSTLTFPVRETTGATLPSTSRESYLLYHYGITERRYQEILDEQGGGCGICAARKKPNGPNLSVDHCHKTGTIRGILCSRCNERLLTSARDQPDILRAAADYLERPGFGKVPPNRLKSKRSKTNRYNNAPRWMQPSGHERKL